MKLTRHNGRSGKHGTYNPRHNDRRFDVENSEHIDAERARQNVYWDCTKKYIRQPYSHNADVNAPMLKELRRILGEENVIYIDDRQGGQ